MGVINIIFRNDLNNLLQKSEYLYFSLMQLFVALGNPGKKYEKTRHNAGWMFADFLADKYNFLPWKEEKRFAGWVSRGDFNGEKTVILKPTTYMNISGKAVQALAHFYRISADKVIIFSDDIDLPFGKVRFKQKGGAGGHNGLKSIFQYLGTQHIPRLKFGISNEQRAKIPTTNFVLMKFSEKELGALKNTFLEGEKVLVKNID